MDKLIREFKNPPAAYRGKPFWCWNGKLEGQELDRQLEVFEKMGMGGAFCHSRTGLRTEYLSDEWFELINRCAAKGKKDGMEIWLYDEDRYPSGTAGGMVTENRELGIHYLRLNKAQGDFKWQEGVICAFILEFKEDKIVRKERIYKDAAVPENCEIWYFTSEIMNSGSFYNGNPYADNANPETVERFIELTHKRYVEKCGEYIKDGTIKGIFTDEPHHGGVMNGFAISNPDGAHLIPHPKNLFKHFENEYGYKLEDYLPEIYAFDASGRAEQVKWHYMLLLQKLFLENFMGKIRDYCHENGLLFTGHVLHEDSLTAQAVMQGSVMRCYEYMDCPGVDVLWEENRDYQIVKQLSSAARQLEKPWLLSELYGCTGWQTNFASYKAMGDWQALLGINMRCQHLSFYTMQGESKRDYPASIFYQSAWWDQFGAVEDYFSRINVLSMGKALCRTLVVNPVESVYTRIHPGWAFFLNAVDEKVCKLEGEYRALFYMLIENKIDFDYGDEEMMSRLASVKDGVLSVGAGKYDTVIVPPCLTLRSSTFELLEKFAAQGGKLILMGDMPGLENALKSGRMEKLQGERIPFDEKELMSRLPVPPVTVKKDGKNVKEILSRVTLIGDRLFVYLINNDRVNPVGPVDIEIEGEGVLERWDARTGEITRLPGGMKLEKTFAPGEEIILCRCASSQAALPENYSLGEERTISEFAYKLEEPNVCVLDQVSIKVDDEEFMPVQEILKADIYLRDRFKIERRSGEMLQPWYKESRNIKEENVCRLTMRFEFECEYVTDMKLALETPELFEVKINGHEVHAGGDWFIDPCIKTADIPAGVIKPGINQVVLTTNFNGGVNLEALYILGQFGVRIDGLRRIIEQLPKTLAAGDICSQGLPFYGGVIEYIMPEAIKGRTRVSALFDGACLQANSGENNSLIAFAPYYTDIDAQGPLSLRLYLTRRNTFGPLHMKPATAFSYGPENFVTQGENFDYTGYMLLPAGLREPVKLTTLKK